MSSLVKRGNEFWRKVRKSPSVTIFWGVNAGPSLALFYSNVSRLGVLCLGIDTHPNQDVETVDLLLE